MLYQIAFSEEIVKKFKREEGIVAASIHGGGKKFESNTQDTFNKIHNSRQLFINLKKSLIMEDNEEANTPTSPKEIGKRQKEKRGNPPTTRYDQIIYNRGSSMIVLPERMVLPNGVEDIMLYPTAVKRNPGAFFAADAPMDGTTRLKHMEQGTQLMWSKDSDPDVIIDREPADD